MFFCIGEKASIIFGCINPASDHIIVSLSVLLLSSSSTLLLRSITSYYLMLDFYSIHNQFMLWQSPLAKT